MKRLALLILLVACGNSDKVPEGVLDRERFTQVMVGAMLIEARIHQEMSSAPGENPPMTAYYTDLFAEHGTDSLGFRRSFDHYALRPEVMEAIYDDVVERLRVMQDEGFQPAALANDTALATDSSSALNR
ncbi:MAG: DUF4296 domain-containing protein [Flavobacteriales bacterium]|nr:DUF4296 domain-containing protein [Flavobacteriales bacterium]